jgi:cell growth-regulating nucleolar protein
MVYFTCGACGEQIKKPQVEKHYTQKCRSCNVLTCIDCLKDFIGDEYKAHNQCMTEAQRYSKSGREGWDPTLGQGNKGERKQQEYMSKLREILDSTQDLKPAVRMIVNTIAERENIPRKKPKFMNFVKNIGCRASPHDIEQTWELFSQAVAPPKPQPQPKSAESMESTEEGAKTGNFFQNINSPKL